MNENPSVNGGSAIKSPHDERDILYTDIAFGAVPFDWDKGYDVEQEISEYLNKPVKIKIKNQNGSGSCGGQSESYGGASISAFYDKVLEEKSAKFTYAPIAYPNGGGSTGRDLSARSTKVGWGSEALTPSYDNGNPPSEAFMARAQDITPEAVEYAAKHRALNYTILPVDIDSIAQAIRDFKFVRLGVVGSNNGTWLTADPKPPTDMENRWYHWVGGMKAKKRNGKKAIGFPNSWGEGAGDKGWQWLNEDYFKPCLSNDPYGAIPIFEPRCYTWNPVPLPPTFHHVFNKDLYYRLVDPENQKLQTALRIDGEFPEGIPYNDSFGPQTLLAVQKFQIKYAIASPNEAGYGRCGPKTRAKLNQLFGQ